MTTRVRTMVALMVICAWAGALGLSSAAEEAAADPLNLYVVATSELPSEPMESGEMLQTWVEVAASGVELLDRDPEVELSLRREDKSEACITEVTIVPALQLRERGSQTALFAVDTAGLPGGRYEVVARIEPLPGERTEADNRARLGFVSVADPRPELHPTELATEPAVPVAWGDTGMVRTTVANTGRLAAGSFHVVFELRPRLIRLDGSSTSGESSPASCDWMEIASRRIPGLARNADTAVSAPLDVAAVLSDGLSQADEGTPQGCLLPPGSELREHEMTFDLRVRVVYPTPDTERAVGELDPDNNTMEGAWKVVPSDLGRPDLVPVAITFDEELPLSWNDPMTATAVIANIGGRATSGGFSVRFAYRATGETTWHPFGPDNDGDGIADARRVSDPLPIEVGENETRIGVVLDPRDVRPSGARLDPGSYELRVNVDPPEPDGSSEVGERNESNNSLIVGFSVRGTELQAQTLELRSAAIHQGDSLIVTAGIANTGDRPTKGFVVGFYLNDQRFDSFVYTNPEGLQEGERTPVQGVLDTRDLPPASYDLRVVIDPDDRIPEFDEGNNTIVMPIQILSPKERRAELHITSVRLDPPSPIPQSSELVCHLVLRNAGEIGAGHFTLVVESSRWLDSQRGWTPYSVLTSPGGAAARALMSGLERGEAVTVRIPLTTRELTEGRYRLRATVDVNGEIAEMAESNNSVMIAFRVGESVQAPPVGGDRPNLTLRDLSVFPGDPCSQPSLELRGTVINTGIRSAPPFRIAFYWFDPLGTAYELAAETIDGLAPGATRSLARTIDTTSFPAGDHQALITADPDDRVDEANETDNHAYLDVRLCKTAAATHPDLVPIAVRFDSPGFTVGEGSSVERNQPLYAHVTVRNQGVIPSGPFSVAFATNDGVDHETWPGIGPQDEAMISHPLPTASPGTSTLVVTVDPDDLVAESDETNNSVPNGFIPEAPTYRVLGGTAVRPERVLAPGPGGCAVRWLAADPGLGRVYAVRRDGRIYALSANDDPLSLGTMSGTVQDVGWAFSGTSRAVVAVSVGNAGVVYRFDLDEGALSGEASLNAPPVGVALGTTGVAYVALPGGFHEVRFGGSDVSISRLVDVSGEVLGIRYDRDRSAVYVLSTTGVHTYGADLSLWCTLPADELVGTPSRFAVAGSGIYVATDRPVGGVLFAASHCTITTGSEGQILVGWRVPRTESFSGAVTSIVIDPRDIDPIYVATDTGQFASLGFDGDPQWQVTTGAAIRSMPVADRRSGRVFFGDDAGIPHVLTLDGEPAFAVDTVRSDAAAIRSTLVILEMRDQTEYGTRFVRHYYYGTEDGAVYRIASHQ